MTEKREPACRIRRILQVHSTADGMLTGTVEGRAVQIPANKAEEGLQPGELAAWDGLRWVRHQPERDGGSNQ